MSKAILVMDMPESCDVCEFIQIDDMCGNMTCMNPVSEEYGCDVSDYIGCKANGCPFRELPQKKSEATATTSGYFKVIGWNECIDEIMKEK